MEDLNHAIETNEEAVELTPVNYPRHVMYLNSLGNALQRRFKRTGSIEDLDRAIKIHKQAVELTPIDYPDRAIYVNNLGNALQSEFERTGSMEGLNHAIKIFKQAVESTPMDHPGHALFLSNLGNSLYSRFERTGLMEDLDDAIETNEKAIELTSMDHSRRTNRLNNLGNALQSRFERTGLMEDLDHAIEIREHVVESTPLDHPDRAMYLNNLGNTLQSRFERTGSMEDLDCAIETIRQAVESTPIDHPNRAMFLINLGNSLEIRFQKTESMDDLDCSILTYEQAADSNTAPPLIRLNGARSCANLLISQGKLKRAKPILEAAVHLLPSLSPRQLKRTDAQFNISQFSNITACAVSLCLENMDDPYRSLQLLELGKGILANLQLEVRSDISELGAVHSELAQQFQQLRDEINSPTRPVESSVYNEAFTGPPELSKAVRERRALLKQFNDLLNYIRSLQGFEDFLRGPSESQLRLLAEHGPIIVFNISDIRSDAFLITAKDKIRSVHLPLLTSTLLNDFGNANIRNLKVRQSNPATGAPIDGDPVTMRDAIPLSSNFSSSYSTEKVLEDLWDAAVGPVLTELGFVETPKSGGEWPHVWWVTSGRLAWLPLHAAGYHRDGSEANVVDRVISSYVPTLKSLGYAWDKMKNPPNEEMQKSLFIAMPVTHRQTSLPGTTREINEISLLIPKDETKTILIDPTKSEVLESLIKCQIAHFACHGMSNTNDPSQSCLLLKDWESDPLSVADIVNLNLENAQFVYLSACSAADNPVETLLDEGIHLTGACQLAGFASVIGTLWHISDRYSIEVALDVYCKMCRTSGRVDPLRAAAGLHSAVRSLRSKLGGNGDNALDWAPYIHLGI